jgi:glutamyl/glutaminyl-tRNA synthetase
VIVPRLRLTIEPGVPGLGIGMARDALFSWLLARSRGGTFLLRSDVDSSDAGEAERSVIDDLLWLGLGWDEGIDAQGGRGPYRRAQRLHLYRSMAVDLLRRGMAYRCDCPRPPASDERVSPAPCACREIVPGDAAAREVAGASSILFRATPTDAAGEVVYVDAVRGEVRRPIEEAGVFVLLRRDGEPGREFAAALDDAMMGITHVVLGSNRLWATCRQALIHAAVGVGAAPVFVHLPPIDAPGESSTGRAEPTATIGRFRLDGYPPEAVLNLLAQLGAATNGRQELLTREEMLAGFDPGRAAGECRPFDPQRLAALSMRHLAQMSPERLADLAAEHLAGAGLLGQPPSRGECGWAGAVARLYAGRLSRMSDLPAEAELFFRFDPGRCLADDLVRQAFREPASRRVIETVVETLAAQPEDEGLTAVRFQALVAAVRRATGAKGKDLYDALRVALTGRPDGPDLAQLIALIERGSRLPLAQRVAGCAERANRLLEASARGGR